MKVVLKLCYGVMYNRTTSGFESIILVYRIVDLTPPLYWAYDDRPLVTRQAVALQLEDDDI